ncbi:MAG: DUF4190 domain-containing protein [Lachnospiraceae bacterium]|nr:DUF4190 domain-containing protein [Lachnospiraceae bacterium]
MDNQNQQGGYQQGGYQQGQSYQDPNVQQGQPYQDHNAQQGYQQGGYQQGGYQQGGYQQPYGQPSYGQQPYGYTPQQSGQGLAIGALVCGIASIVFVFFFALGGVIAGIVGLILASLAKKQGNYSGMRTAGLVMSIIGLIICAISIIVAIACVASFYTAGGNILNSLYRYMR